MPADAGTSPAERLQPLPWHPGCEPAAAPPADPTMPPLLLLLDRRQPIGEEIRQCLAASLSCLEQRRLSAYRLAADKERFLLGRGSLRRLLGLWLGLPPEAVPLETGPRGKPHCACGPAFNLSHSGDLILLAAHASRAVGVDVERLRPSLHWQAIANRMLPPPERQALAAFPERQRPEAFLAAWCRLEARLKAHGTGLVARERLGAEVESAPLSAAWARAEPLWDVAVPEGYRAAVALAPPSLTARTATPDRTAPPD